MNYFYFVKLPQYFASLLAAGISSLKAKNSLIL